MKGGIDKTSKEIGSFSFTASSDSPEVKLLSWMSVDSRDGHGWTIFAKWIRSKKGRSKALTFVTLTEVISPLTTAWRLEWALVTDQVIGVTIVWFGVGRLHDHLL